MNLSRIKKALSHATTEELAEIATWVSRRRHVVLKKEQAIKVEEAWERIRHLKVGDKLYSHDASSRFWKAELTITAGPRPRAKDLWLTMPGRPTLYLRDTQVDLHDLRPEPCPQAVLEIINGEPAPEEPIPF